MGFEIPLATRVADSCCVETFKSWTSFSDYFEDATQMQVVTYCDSPEFILQMFDTLDELDELEVIVGDVDDYRDRLVDKPDTADRLERLRREGKLIIYLCETKEVHSKLYLIQYDDESDGTPASLADYGGDANGNGSGERRVRIIVGSPNLSKNAWSNQTNVGIVYETTHGSDLHENFRDLYEEHRAYNNNNGPFLEDLTERIEGSGESREKSSTCTPQAR